MSEPLTPLAYLVPSALAGQPLHDVMERLTATLVNERCLVLRGSLARGLYEMSLKTVTGTFPSESVMLHLTEWPSRRSVLAGPFDLDHTEFRMAVPTFRVFVNGRDWGLVWCEVPSPDDMKARRVRAMWGIRVEESGAVELRLEVPPDERRLRWQDIEEITLGTDDRYSIHSAMDSALAGRPRLFGDEAMFARLSRGRDAIQQAILDNLQERLRKGDDGSYVNRPVIAALVGRLTGEAQWIEVAIARVLEHCRRPYWGYHNVPDIMGWNNDRDTGMKMFETAAVYDWLFHRLAEDQRELVRQKLAYHAEIAYKVTVLQKNYWYYRTAEAHGQGLWFGFAAAALALVGDDPRAPEWLDWIHGNIADALLHAPEDGISEWPVFNAQWLILTTMMLERSCQRRLSGELPFLRNFGRNIVKFVGEGGVPPTLLFYLADRYRSGRCQADALRAARLTSDGRRLGDRNFDALALLAYNPALSPSRPTPVPLSACSRNGTILCRSRDRKVLFTFRCGTPLTPRQHWAHNWINRSWYHSQHAGSFSWDVGRQTLVPICVPGYRQRTADSNLITVDGGGNHTDGRWLGYAIPLSDLPYVEHFATGGGVSFCCANATRAYEAEYGVRRQVRRWVFFHDCGVLVMHDMIETDRPRNLAWHIHGARATWQADDGFAFSTQAGESRLAVRPVFTRIDDRPAEPPPTALATEIAPTCFVPPYTLGLNTYKTRDWQPEITPEKLDIPDFPDLRFSPYEPAFRWELVTLIGPCPLPAAAVRPAADGNLAIVSIGDAGAIMWCRGEPTLLEGLAVSVEADVVVRLGSDRKPRRWIAFRTRQWRRDGACFPLDRPTDLVWLPGRATPALELRRERRTGRKKA